MSKASLELGGGNWAAKDTKLLGYAVGDTSGKYLPREFTFSRGADIGENQFTYSNDFRSSLHWGHAGLAAYYGPNNNPSQVPDGEQGYDGSGGASFLLSNTNTTPPTTVHQFNTTTPNIAAFQTFSIYAKALGYKWLVIRTNSSTMESYFDLENGEVGTVESDVVQANMVNAGNGWYRCSMAVNNSATVTSVAFGISDGDNNHNFAGSRDEGGTNRGGIYVQDAQWERGVVLTDYLESGSTTGKAGVLDDLPRIDYTSGSAQLLMEPSRTNATVTDNDTTSPDGSNNAAKFLASGSGTVNHQIDSASATIPSGAVSASIFAKKGNTDFVRLRLNGTTSNIRAWFDLSNGTTGSVDGGGTSSMTSMGDGWYRCTVTEAGNTNTSTSLQVFINESDGQTTWVADGDEYIYIYGAQLESGEFSTSYIPTYGASDTRAAEVCETIDDLNIGNSYTILFDFDQTHSPVVNTITFQTENSSDADAIEGRWYGDVDGFRIYDEANDAYPISTIYSSSTKKWVARIDGTTSFDLFHNDSGTPTKRSGTALSSAVDLKQFKIKANGPRVNNIKIFDSALSDSECNALVE
jgi:hypothetical protein